MGIVHSLRQDGFVRHRSVHARKVRTRSFLSGRAVGTAAAAFGAFGAATAAAAAALSIVFLLEIVREC